MIFLSVLSTALALGYDVSEFFTKLLGYDPGYSIESGYEHIDWYFNSTTPAEMYYLLQTKYASKLNDTEVPVVVWLQGGPGGSSMFGCFNEVGGIAITGNSSSGFKAIENFFSWNNLGHLLCVDQPLNVGFSYSSANVTDSRTAARHFNNFLHNFLKRKGLSKNPVYLTGESFAGHYIPAIASQIVSNRSLGINLQGVAIGDGWVDPVNQLGYYGEYLYNVGVQGGHIRDHFNWFQKEGMLNLLNGKFAQGAYFINYMIANETVMRTTLNNMSIYNFRITDFDGQKQGNINPWYAKFLNLTDTRKQLHIPDNVPFRESNDDMYNWFAEDLAESYVNELQSILRNGVRTLIYNGQNDYIVNTAGVLNYLDSVQWPFAAGWKATEKKHFREFGELMGWYKNFENLNFVAVYDAGHLLPSDQPRNAYVMLRNFMHNSFQ